MPVAKACLIQIKTAQINQPPEVSGTMQMESNLAYLTDVVLFISRYCNIAVNIMLTIAKNVNPVLVSRVSKAHP